MNEQDLGMTLVVEHVDFVADNQVILSCKPFSSQDAVATLQHNVDARGFLNKHVWFEYGSPKIDHIDKVEDKLRRVCLIEERNICFRLDQIKCLDNGNLELHGFIAGPFGDTLKSQLVDPNGPVMFGTRCIVNDVDPYPQIITFDRIFNSKRLEGKRKVVSSTEELFEALRSLHCDALGIPPQIIMGHTMKPFRNHDDVKAVEREEVADVKLSALSLLNRLPGIGQPSGPVVAEGVDWLALLNESYLEANNFTGRVQSGEFTPDMTPRMIRDGELELEWGGELEDFMETVLDITTYDGDVAISMTEQILKVAEHILNGTTRELLDRGEEYKMFLWTLQLSCFKNSLNWGTSIRHPWFEAGNGTHGCHPFQPPFQCCDDERDEYVIQDSDELKRYWRAVIDFYNQFK